MTKRIKVLFTKDEIDHLKEIMDNSFYNFTDNLSQEELKKNKDYQRLCKIDNKLTKGLNKTGIYYLWQLKDREGEVTPDNIKDEWK